jgi:hypothetical protein
MGLSRVIGFGLTIVLLISSLGILALNIMTENYDSALDFTVTEHMWYSCRGKYIDRSCSATRDYKLFKRESSTSRKVGWLLLISNMASFVGFLLRYTFLWNKVKEWMEENLYDPTRWISLSINQSVKFAFVCHMIGFTDVTDWVTNFSILFLIRLFPIFVRNAYTVRNYVLIVLTFVCVWSVPFSLLFTTYTWANVLNTPAAVTAIVGITAVHIMSIDVIHVTHLVMKEKDKPYFFNFLYDCSHTVFELLITLTLWMSLFKI